MFNFSKKTIFNFKYFFSLICFVSISLSFGQNINYSAGNISTDSEENLILENSVSLQIDNLSILTEKLVLNQEARTGFAENLSFKIEQNNFWGEAKSLDLNEGKISFKNVSFSLCPCFEKIWWLEASEISLSENSESVNFKNAKLKVQGRTLGAWPKGSFPASSDKRSGFLLPEINISNKSGTDASIPYYFNLRENLDATLEPRYISKRGFGLSNELRYLSQNFNGIINSSLLANDKEFEDDYNENSFRWSFTLNHNYSLNKDSFFQINYSNISDAFFYNDFGGDFNGTSKTLYSPQQIVISNFSQKHKAVFKINTFKIVNPIGQNQFQELPRLELSWFDANESFNYGIDSNFSIYRKGGSFFDTTKGRLKNYNVSPYMNFSRKNKTIITEAITKINFSRFNLEESSVTNIQPQVVIKFSSELYKKEASKISFLRPYVSFSFSPEKSTKNVPLINSGIPLQQDIEFENDLVGQNFQTEKKDLIFGVTNEIYNHKNKIIEFHVSKKIKSNNKLNITNINYDLPEPYTLGFNYFPSKISALKINLKVDEDKKFNTFNFNFERKFTSSSFLMNYFMAEDINSYLFNNSSKRKLNQIDAEFKFSKNLKYNFISKINYDIENSNLNNLVLGLEYDNPGLKLGLALIHSKGLDWTKLINESLYEEYNQESFRIYFELKGLGSLGRPINNYLGEKTLN